MTEIKFEQLPVKTKNIFINETYKELLDEFMDMGLGSTPSETQLNNRVDYLRKHTKFYEDHGLYFYGTINQIK